MGIFDSIFGSDTPRKDEVWNVLVQNEEVDEIFMASNSAPQVILKHSNSCGTSYFAKKM